MGRTIAWVVSLGLLVVTGVLGIYNGFIDWGEAGTALQESVTAGVLLYGLLGLITAYGLFRRRRWSFSTTIGWGLVITYVSGAAVIAYAGADTGVGSAIAASGASALIALGVVWTANVMTRPRVPADSETRSEAMSLAITSPVFQQGGPIPARYTCEGQDVSPPLEWSGAPANTKTLALIVDDPDAPDPAKPQRVYVHWVVYNIPASVTSLKENASKTGMPKGAVQGKNDWGKAEYGGPCPPIGRHRYFFKLYALDIELTGLSGGTKTALEQAMKGHVVDSGELIGTYQKAAAKL
jgi:Raf kinase inhibitor-like YbhB/YbcL family protein